MSARELWLKEALSEVLEVDAAQISATRTFAEQGVDSLIGLRLTRKLEDALGVEVDLEWLFDHPSIHALAQFLDSRFGALDATPSPVDHQRRIEA
ncbi:acyl carrier protein [Xanthomonas sp. LMG 8992]|uniref:acyl carrier protein n=1 Tax=Xanthomonas sp. LMG 8992 TaxID=1591157 RepID=UPI0013683178|nr:acyl carrier protein [Xanthomonas sp. LMG 8992]MXV13078.1 acyl carrier protein [Xanthomonas sp. LMG 8992]